VGSYHLNVKIDSMVSAAITVFQSAVGRVPKFRVHGGSNAENLALQNIQARMRMVLSYLFASLLPWVRGHNGYLLVLSCGNVDEALRGYMTKYDCSSGDINPIGAISKEDLKRFLRWASVNLGYSALEKVIHAAPTAELEPITETYAQTDEEDMGMSYEELGIFGRLRSLDRCGPVSMFERLSAAWTKSRGLSVTQIAEKVKRFYYYYSVNRHKLTVLTPAYHAEKYSPDDHRFDHRQFLYNTSWQRQFNGIDAAAARIMANSTPPQSKL
jgi:NAD+ synthase (glutamine-hydrolysing)